MYSPISALLRLQIATKHHKIQKIASYINVVRKIATEHCYMCASPLHHLPRVSHRFSQKRQYSLKNKLNDILISMSKETDVKGLQESRLARKQKSKNENPSVVYLQVLGSGAPGAPRSLYVFTSKEKYLFNCGEGSQRFAAEHKVKLARLEHILITHKSWENVGGLPGMLLTVQDIGIPDITIHGPPGINCLHNDTREFLKYHHMKLMYRNYKENGGRFGKDNDSLYIWSVPLHAKEPESIDTDQEKSVVQEIYEDAVDLLADKNQKPRKSSDTLDAVPNEQTSDLSSCRNISMAYICRPPYQEGRLLREECVKAGVPIGPMFGDLKKGKDVTLPNGKIIRAADVVTPGSPGPVFIVVEAPTEQYLDSLLENKALAAHQYGAEEADIAEVVFHFTPGQVLNHERYQEWMARFPSSTSHILINSDSKCMGLQATHKIQYQLNHINDKLFPLLSDESIPIIENIGQGQNEQKNGGEMMANSDKMDKSGNTEAIISSNIGPMYQATTSLTYHIRPKKKLDRSNDLSLQPQSYIQECYDNIMVEFESIYQQLKSKLASLTDQEKLSSNCNFPNVTFLGTGSREPSKTRNSSGILMKLSSDKCVLMDCGEGTFGQFVRLLGMPETDLVLRKLKAIYISHLHFDHHWGFIRLLQARRKAFKSANIDEVPKLLLLAPRNIMSYLSSYHINIEPILNDFTHYDNTTLISTHAMFDKGIYNHLCSELDMKAIDMTYVIHCRYSFGVAWTHKDGWKIVYSGDTMPCKDLIEIGKDCDLLIHEATMEDELEEDARMKKHSTTSQAIEVGKKMNAKFTLLTHFSQRYSKIPLIDNFPDDVGIAFDNMQVSLKDLPMLPLMNDALKAMFNERYMEMQERTYKKYWKRKRTEEELAKQKQRKVDS